MIVYAREGFNEQQIGGNCPSGWIQMEIPRPDSESAYGYRAKADGTWALDSEKISREAFKNERELAVSRITVEVSGVVFDGDEVSQGRMARAIVGMQSKPEGSTVQWVMHDNTIASVGIAELQEALTLAVLRQAELWVQA